MDFHSPPHLKAIQAEAEAFAAEHVTADVIEDELRTGDGVSRPLLRAMGAKGWVAPMWPPEEGGAGLIPAGEVVEVGILAEGIEVGKGLVGGEDDGDALVEGSAEADAAVVVVGGGLAVEGEEGQGKKEKKKGETGAGPHREGV